MHTIAQRIICSLLFIWISFFYTDVDAEDLGESRPIWSVGKTIAYDYVSFYSIGRLARMGIVFGLGGITANTSIDSEIHDWYQNDVRNSWSDDGSKKAKLLGEGKYLIPLSLIAASVNLIDNESRIGSWGMHAARAYIVGLPPMWVMQNVTGGSRPDEEDHESKWCPLNDTNGVSGHAFVGAVPFLTLAYMNRENRFIQYLSYAASFAAAWSRINDKAHYLSQSALGWYMAWEAVDSVFDSTQKQNTIDVRPMITPNSYGLTVSISW